MKKALSLLLASVMVLSLTACGGSKKDDSAASDNSGSGDAAAATYEFKLGTDCSDPALSPDYNGYGMQIAKFCELVSEKTNGQVTITPYYESVLGGQSELLTQVRDNELDMFYGQAQSNFDSRFAFKAIPYLVADVDALHRLMANPDGELYKLYASILEEYNIHLIGQGVGTFRGLFNNKHQVATPEDMKDLTMRIYEDPVVKYFWAPICNASVISFSEVYTALQTKTCDAMEIAAGVGIYSKFYEVCDHYTDINWQFMSQGFLLSDKCWNTLPDDLRQIVVDCAWESSEYEYEKEKEFAAEAMGQLSELGCEVYQLSDDERQAWVDYARSHDDEFRDYIGADFYDQAMSIVEADAAANA